ncbi:MAG: hypothetical protein CMO01_26655 [Thalassobius sp.]|nr:hypothetical protein [Thalassovita sp.]
MKKLLPKGTVNKKITLSLTDAERNRYKAFCKAIGMNYSEVFRYFCNEMIQNECKRLKVEITNFEPEIQFEINTEEELKKNRQLDLFGQE